jgi:hypothetical protein
MFAILNLNSYERLNLVQQSFNTSIVMTSGREK